MQTKRTLADYPDLVAEFDLEKNFPKTPEDYSHASHKKVWWVCSNHGHSWQATIKNRTLGSAGCLYCSGQALLQGFNDLASRDLQLAAEFDTEKNLPHTPQNVGYRSPLKLWWVCSWGHSYQSRLHDRRKGVGCAVCDGKKVLQGFNDMRTLNPVLADQFDLLANYPHTPESISPNTHRKMWWVCSLGHKWQAVSKNRHNGSGCPTCSIFYSAPEASLREALSGTKQRVVLVGSKTNTKEVDMVLDCGTVVEYDGEYWHKNKEEQDSRLTRAMIASGRTVVRVREGRLGRLPSQRGLYQLEYNSNTTSFNQLAKDIKSLLNNKGVHNADETTF